jgi:flagellar M-ring protein FliF
MDAAVAGTLNQQQLQDLVGNAVGLNVTRGDAITLAAMPFDTSVADAAAAEMEAARQADDQAKLWSMVRSGAIAAGIVLVVLVVWLRSRKRVEEVEEEYEPLALDDAMLAELERLRVSSTREAVVRDTAQLEAEAAERQRVRGEISTMVSERPDEVAAMLRGWLTENKA